MCFLISLLFNCSLLYIVNILIDKANLVSFVVKWLINTGRPCTIDDRRINVMVGAKQKIFSVRRWKILNISFPLSNISNYNFFCKSLLLQFNSRSVKAYENSLLNYKTMTQLYCMCSCMTTECKLSQQYIPSCNSDDRTWHETLSCNIEKNCNISDK